MAELLQVPEDALRSAPNPHSGAHSHVMPATLGYREALLSSIEEARQGPDIPVYSDEEKIASDYALERTRRPPRLATAKGAFVLWISRPRGRLRPGDLAYVRVRQPARLGDTVVALQDDRVVAVGDLVGLDDQHAEVRDGDELPRKFERKAVSLLKVVSAELA